MSSRLPQIGDTYLVMWINEEKPDMNAPFIYWKSFTIRTPLDIAFYLQMRKNERLAWAAL